MFLPLGTIRSRSCKHTPCVHATGYVFRLPSLLCHRADTSVRRYPVWPKWNWERGLQDHPRGFDSSFPDHSWRGSDDDYGGLCSHYSSIPHRGSEVFRDRLRRCSIGAPVLHVVEGPKHVYDHESIHLTRLRELFECVPRNRYQERFAYEEGHTSLKDAWT
jgi:hypothetical protein